MIYINHNKKAIFIHIPKTGGSYIGPTLEKYYGFNSYLHLMYRKRKDHYIICKSKSIHSNNKIYDNSFFNREIGIYLYFKTCDEYNKIMQMNEEKWQTYTKFCFIRNPYERALSGWKHFKIIFNFTTNFYDYLNMKNIVSDIEYGHIFINQKMQIINENGECAIDIIGRFENLENDFRIILNYLGFNVNHPIKKINMSNKENFNGLILERKTINKINEIYKDDFDAFHYIQM